VSDGFIGKKIGKYELVERLGRGGMAEVYKAYQRSLDRHVAIKILHPFLGEDPEFKERFETEARNVAKLHHPHIVQVFDFDFDPNRELYYMVMEFIDGPTLKTRLLDLDLSGSVMPINDALKIIRDVGSALGYAHSRSMIHRDVKPGNVMLDKDGRVVLTDFGIARIVSGPNMTASGAMVGTPTYMSPEQGLGQSGDHRADIYSLGVMLYQLVTGGVPYEADTPVAVVLKHVNEALPAPSERNPEIPEAVERIIYKAMAKAPENRYQSVADFTKHLDSLIVSTTLVLERPKTIPEIIKETEITTEIPRPTAEDDTDIFVSGTVRRSSCFGLIAAFMIAVLAAAAGAYIAYSGLINRVTPLNVQTEVQLTATPPLPIVAPVDADPQLEATIQALDRVDGSQQEGDVCTYAYDLVSRTPAQGAEFTENTTVEQRFIIANSGSCDIPAGAAFTLQGGAAAPETIPLEGGLQPGEAAELVVNVDVPALDDDDPTLRLVWVLTVEDEPVGQPLTIDATVVDEEN
jgi:serine/threonine protein kinase